MRHTLAVMDPRLAASHNVMLSDAVADVRDAFASSVNLMENIHRARLAIGLALWSTSRGDKEDGDE